MFTSVNSNTRMTEQRSGAGGIHDLLDRGYCYVGKCPSYYNHTLNSV